MNLIFYENQNNQNSIKSCQSLLKFNNLDFSNPSEFYRELRNLTAQNTDIASILKISNTKLLSKHSPTQLLSNDELINRPSQSHSQIRPHTAKIFHNERLSNPHLFNNQELASFINK